MLLKSITISFCRYSSRWWSYRSSIQSRTSLSCPRYAEQVHFVLLFITWLAECYLKWIGLIGRSVTTYSFNNVSWSILPFFYILLIKSLNSSRLEHLPRRGFDSVVYLPHFSDFLIFSTVSFSYLSKHLSNQSESWTIIVGVIILSYEIFQLLYR